MNCSKQIENLNDVKQVKVWKNFKSLLDSFEFANVMNSYHLLEFCCVGAHGE